MNHGVDFSTDFNQMYSNSIHLRKQQKKHPAAITGQRVICHQSKNTIALVPKSEKNMEFDLDAGRLAECVWVSVCKFVAVSVNRLNSKFGLYNSIKRISNQTVNYYAGQLRSIKIESGIFHILKLTFSRTFVIPPFGTNFLNCCLQLNQMESNRMECSVWFSFNAFLNVTHSHVCCLGSEILAPKLSPNVCMKWAFIGSNERPMCEEAVHNTNRINIMHKYTFNWPNQMVRKRYFFVRIECERGEYKGQNNNNNYYKKRSKYAGLLQR